MEKLVSLLTMELRRAFLGDVGAAARGIFDVSDDDDEDDGDNNTSMEDWVLDKILPPLPRLLVLLTLEELLLLLLLLWRLKPLLVVTALFLRVEVTDRVLFLFFILR